MSEKTPPTIEKLGFGFILKFAEQPTTEEFCSACISVFQNASMALMQKEPIREALEDAIKEKTLEFGFSGHKNPETGELEVNIGVVSKQQKIITPKRELSIAPIVPMSRQQRRAAERKKR